MMGPPGRGYQGVGEYLPHASSSSDVSSRMSFQGSKAVAGRASENGGVPRHAAAPLSPLPSSNFADVEASSYPASILLDNIPSVEENFAQYACKNAHRQPAFRLVVRQHPRHAMALGDDTSSTKTVRPSPLDPPLVCELIAARQEDEGLIGIPELSLRARLVHASNPTEEVKQTPSGQPAIMGDCDQTAFLAQIFPPSEQSLFIFPDISCRLKGQFRLRIDVVDRSLMAFNVLGSIYSAPFEVHDRKSFPGLSPSTELIQAVVRRGLKLRLVKPSNGKRLQQYDNGKKRRIDPGWTRPFDHEADCDFDDDDSLPSPASSRESFPQQMPFSQVVGNHDWLRLRQQQHHREIVTPRTSVSTAAYSPSQYDQRDAPLSIDRREANVPADAVQNDAATSKPKELSRFEKLLEARRRREAEVVSQPRPQNEEVLPMIPVLQNFIDDSFLRRRAEEVDDASRQTKSHKCGGSRPGSPSSWAGGSSKQGTLSGSGWPVTSPSSHHSTDRRRSLENLAVADSSPHQTSHRYADGFSSLPERPSQGRTSPTTASSKALLSGLPGRSYDSARSRMLASTSNLRTSDERGGPTSDGHPSSLPPNSKEASGRQTPGHSSDGVLGNTHKLPSLPSIHHIFDAVDSKQSDYLSDPSLRYEVDSHVRPRGTDGTPYFPPPRYSTHPHYDRV